MSGGSYDYKYQKITELSGEILSGGDHRKLRTIVSTVLAMMGSICHDIEWIDSDDMGDHDWKDEIIPQLIKLQGYMLGVQIKDE